MPHPTGAGYGGSAERGVAAPVTPARLPPSRWARRSDARRLAAAGDDDGGGGGAGARSVAATRSSSFVLDPAGGSRKRKSGGDDGAAADSEGRGGPLAGSVAGSVKVVATNGGGLGAGRRVEKDEGGAGGAKDSARASADSAAAAAGDGDASDEAGSAPPRPKRARTSSEGFLEINGGRAKGDVGNASPRKPAVGGTMAGGTGGGSGGGRGGGCSGGGGSSLDHQRNGPLAVPVKNGLAEVKDCGNGNGSSYGVGGGSNGSGSNGSDGIARVGGEAPATPVSALREAPVTPAGGQDSSRMTEEERRLETRRRGRQGRSPYIYGGGRVDPNAGLPRSARPPAVGGGESGGSTGPAAAASAKTPSKVWTDMHTVRWLYCRAESGLLTNVQSAGAARVVVFDRSPSVSLPPRLRNQVASYMSLRIPRLTEP